VGLEFDRVGANVCDSIDVCMGHAERAVMRLSYFGNNERGKSRTNRSAVKTYGLHWFSAATAAIDLTTREGKAC
jgi:hypothetical protein